MQHDHLLVGTRGLSADAERHAHAHGAERAGIEPVARNECRDGLAAVVEDLLAIDAKDGIAIHEVANLFA